MRLILSSLAAVCALSLGACVRVKTDPIEVKPIRVTVDVNVRIEKAVDDFFADLDKRSSTLSKE